MDMVSLQIIPPEQALKLMELGGPQKVLDIVSAAEKKAQRENMRMKAFKDKPDELTTAKQEFFDQAVQMVEMERPDMLSLPPEQLRQEIEGFRPPVIPVDDFDLHEVHIETHNRYGMS